MALVAAHIRSVVDQDGAVILDIKRDQFFSLNPIGSYIWSQLCKGEDQDVIAKMLAEETGADLDIVMADVHDFVADLKNRQFLESAFACCHHEGGKVLR